MEKKELFKRLVNNPKYTSLILQTINEYDFIKRHFLILTLDGQVIVLYQKGNDIKVKK